MPLTYSRNMNRPRKGVSSYEDGFKLGAALQRRSAALLPAHYFASSHNQRLDLGIVVLIDS